MNINIYLTSTTIIHIKGVHKVGFYRIWWKYSLLRVWDKNHKVIAEYHNALGWDKDI